MQTNHSPFKKVHQPKPVLIFLGMNGKMLEKVPWSLAEQILEILRIDWPTNVFMYTTLKTHYKVRSLGPDHKYFLLTPGGKVDEFATFLVMYQGKRSEIFFHSCNPDPEIMMGLLKHCEYLDWKKPIWFGPTAEKYESPLLKLISELNVETFFREKRATIYWSDPEWGKNLTYQCPPEVYIAPVEMRHAELINSVWPHRDDSSITWVRKMIQYLGGFGLFLKDTDELVSWTIRTMFGGPGFLQTIEGQKKKGYGLLMATAMTKDFNQKGEYSALLVVDGNTPSQKLFSKLNYKKESGIYWFKIGQGKS